MSSRRRLIPWIAAGATAVLTAVMTISSTTVGFVLTTRRPRNSIGWILRISRDTPAQIPGNCA